MLMLLCSNICWVLMDLNVNLSGCHGWCRLIAIHLLAEICLINVKILLDTLNMPQCCAVAMLKVCTFTKMSRFVR